MQHKCGRGAIALFLCLVFFSVLLFLLLENRGISKAQSGEAAGSQLIEVVDPEMFIGPMGDYDYDLYRKSPDGAVEFVPPSEQVFEEAGEADSGSFNELRAATDQIDPASRETTINIYAMQIPGASWTQGVTTQYAGSFLFTGYEIIPATKTEILSDGSTAEVWVLPAAVDVYVALKEPRRGRFSFLTRYSGVKFKLYNKPRKFASNTPIILPPTGAKSILISTRLKSSMSYGYWTLYMVMVPPGEPLDVKHPERFLSNIAKYTFFFKG